MTRPSPTSFVLASLLCALACASDDSEPADGGSDGAGSDSVDTGSSGDWPPAACSLDDSPFVQTACLGALREACLANASEAACGSQPELDFGDGGYAIRCGWAKVVTITDIDACTPATVTHRCEALVGNLTCGDSCEGEALQGTVSAIPIAGELVDLCGGPLGEWSAVDDDSDQVSGCGENLTPPQPPLCDCLDVACNAE